jgi:purine catabolism regulator
MRVKDLLQLETLSGLRVLAGEEGIDREVASVSVMDAPDICDWMRGGEFLITSGYTIKTHPVELETLIRGLDRIEVAALGIKVDRFIERVPDEVLDTANLIRFPIIHIPNEYPFVDIINPVLAEIVNQQARQLLYSEEIHNAFLDLALGEKSIQEVVDTLGRIIGKEVVFKDYVFHQTYLSPGADLHRLTASTTVKHPVATAARSYGRVYVLSRTDRETGKYERIAIEHANTVLILLLQKQLSNREIEYRYRSELIHDILTRNYRSLEEVQTRAALYGWRFHRGMRAIVYDIDDFKLGYLKRSRGDRPLEWIHEPIIRIIRSHLRARFPCYYITYSDTIVFLVEHAPVDEKRFKADLAGINEKIGSEVEAETDYTLTVGVGNYKPGIEAVPESYEEAKLAVEISGQRGERGGTVFYGDLGIYKLLHEISDVLEKQDLVEETLAPLIAYDRQHDTAFCQTLATLVELDWNLQRTSEALHIHYNTAKYRLKRAEEILGLDFSVYGNKLKVALAVCWRNIGGV